MIHSLLVNMFGQKKSTSEKERRNHEIRIDQAQQPPPNQSGILAKFEYSYFTCPVQNNNLNSIERNDGRDHVAESSSM